MPQSEFKVIPLRAFRDNYVWTLRNARCAAVVDPGEAQPVLDYLAAEKLQLVAILATHHHQDHAEIDRCLRIVGIGGERHRIDLDLP